MTTTTDTSHEAFRKTKSGQKALRTLVYNAFLRAGDEGRTSKEVELELQRSHESVSARVHELLRQGFLVPSGQTRKNPSGMMAQVLVVPSKVREGNEPTPKASVKPTVCVVVLPSKDNQGRAVSDFIAVFSTFEQAQAFIRQKESNVHVQPGMLRIFTEELNPQGT